MEEQKNNRIAERLGLLRKDMLEHGVDYYLAVSTDPHTSEYVDDHFKVTEFFSGCTSDNAALLVDRESARLWTDGRYFISAAREMAGSGIELMRMGEEGVPTLPAFLRGRLKKGEVLGFNGRNVRASDGKKYRSVCARIGAKDLNTYSPEERIWKDRCPLSSAPVWILPDEISGRSFPDKLADLKDEIEKKGAKSLVISKLDDIMWLFNIRGGDVECNPVALSYALIGTEEVHLFLQRAEVTEEFAAYAGEHGICLLGAFTKALHDFLHIGRCKRGNKIVHYPCYSFIQVITSYLLEYLAQERIRLRDEVSSFCTGEIVRSVIV